MPNIFQKKLRIQVLLDVMENYLHVGNTSPEFWMDIALTYFGIRVAQNWHNTINILKKVSKDFRDWMHFNRQILR